MSVHYKFKSALEYDTVTFDGLHISVKDLKNAIAQKKMIGKTTDFDLQVTNAQTKEIYEDENALIPKNTSLLIARIPNAVQNKSKQWEGYGGDATPPAKLDEGGPIGKAVDLSSLDAPEDDKIKAMISQSTQEYDPSNYMKIRGANQMGEVPQSYRCYKCHKGGHWIKDCPLSKGPEPIEIKKSTGIPLSFMVPVDGPQVQGAMMTPNGGYAVPVLDHQTYTQKQPVQSVQEVAPEIPEDLLCSICSDLLQDAVMIPCCGNSFCDECIRSALLESEDHECPDCHEKDISPGTLIPNRFLRTSVGNFKNTTGYVKRPSYKKEEPKTVKTGLEEKTVISEADSTEHAKNEAKIEEKNSPKPEPETPPEGPPGVSPESESPKVQPIGKVESSRDRAERNSRPVKPQRLEESPPRRHRHRSPYHETNNRTNEDRPGTPTIDEPGHASYHSYPPSTTRAPPTNLMVQPAPMQAPPPGFPPPYTNGPPPPNFRIPPPGAPPYVMPPQGYGPPPQQPTNQRPVYDATSRPPPPVFGGGYGHRHHHHHHREYVERGRGMRGRSPPPGTIDDPLAAFNRMLREKDERDRRKRGRRSRSRSWSRSPRRMRSRSPRRRSRSRSFSISRSRSRSFSGSPFRDFSPPPRRPKHHRYRSPGQRSPPRHHRKEGGGAAERYRSGYEHERPRGYSRERPPAEQHPRRDEREREYPNAYESYDDRMRSKPNWQPRVQQEHYYPPDFQNRFPARDYGYKPDLVPQPVMRQYEDVPPPGVEEPPIPGVEDAPPLIQSPPRPEPEPTNHEAERQRKKSRTPQRDRTKSPERHKKRKPQRDSSEDDKYKKTKDKKKKKERRESDKKKKKDKKEKHRDKKQQHKDEEKPTAVEAKPEKKQHEVKIEPEKEAEKEEEQHTPEIKEAIVESEEVPAIIPEDSEGILDLHPTDLDLKTDPEPKNELSHLLPEKSKWETEIEFQLSPKETESAGKTDKKAQVTNEVLKRAENAIFAKAINAIRPIEIKKISTERAKLYANQDEEEEEEEEVEIIEEKPAERKRIEAPSPTHLPRVSVKDRLGIKIDDIKAERTKSSSMSPFSRRSNEGSRNYGQGERRVEILDKRRRREQRSSRDGDKYKSHRKRSRSRRREPQEPVKREEKKRESEDRTKKKKDKVVKTKKEKKEPEKKERKTTLDEANFEPDYDLESESEKDDKKKARPDEQSSSSETSETTSEDERSKKKKHKKHKKRKKRDSSSTSSESETESSDEDRDKKRKKHKKNKKKKKRSKHK